MSETTGLTVRCRADRLHRVPFPFQIDFLNVIVHHVGRAQ